MVLRPDPLPHWLLLLLFKLIAAKAKAAQWARMQGSGPASLPWNREWRPHRRNKSLPLMKRFLRQSGMTGLRVKVAGELCSSRHTAPSTKWIQHLARKWARVCRGVCAAQGSQGLAGPGLPRQLEGSRHRAPKCGLCVTRRNYTGQFKYSLYFSLPLRFSLYFHKQ